MGHKPDQRARKNRRNREARSRAAKPPDKREAQVRALAVRRQRNKGIIRIDNRTLRAGSPMYFYCRLCGGEIQLPETFDPPAPSHCDDCHSLREQGWNDAKQDFSNDVKICGDCAGKGRRVYAGFGERTCHPCEGRGKIIIEAP
jgi:RNA polymerase-binding transcription factor DksA